MQDLRETAKQYIKNGLWVIPITSMKQPSISNWTELQTRPMTEKEIEKSFKKCHGMALLMGGSPRLFAVDFDLKYADHTHPNLYEDIKNKIPREILEKTYVQKTVNGGYHWIYKVPKNCLFGNEKFANRYTTFAEKMKIFKEYSEDPKTRDDSFKIACNYKSLVLVESRSGSEERCGGYALMPPTPGYSLVYGKIKELSEEEYNLLTETLRSFNEVKELSKPSRNYDTFNWKLTPWEDYNERGDIVSLLLECGWTYDPKFESAKSIRFKRPGAKSGSSALFDKESRIFNCFSTSTSLSVDKGYTPSSLYIELETDGDTKLAYSNLVSLDFGIKN